MRGAWERRAVITRRQSGIPNTYLMHVSDVPNVLASFFSSSAASRFTEEKKEGEGGR